MYFNPRTPRGGATELYQETNRDTIFQSTHPTRGCDRRMHGESQTHGNFNPRTPRGGATEEEGLELLEVLFQSTHPTRGCDMLPSSSLLSRLFQSTHPTRGCDCSQIAFNASCFKFQSTHPTRGCDQPGRWTWTTYKHFNPRTPRGGATWILGRPGLQISISIHAPHEGVRPIGISSGVISLYFNPRTPRGGATFLCLLQ